MKFGFDFPEPSAAVGDDRLLVRMNILKERPRQIAAMEAIVGLRPLGVAGRERLSDAILREHVTHGHLPAERIAPEVDAIFAGSTVVA